MNSLKVILTGVVAILKDHPASGSCRIFFQGGSGPRLRGQTALLMVLDFFGFCP
jgi:hypothetical protein